MPRLLMTSRMRVANTRRLNKIKVVDPPDEDVIPDYVRKEWGAWKDFDGDKQNARAEILIQKHRAHMEHPLLFTKSDHRTVKSGRWRCPYTGRWYFLASDMDIDHVVPLRVAHYSGGWEWDKDTRRRYSTGWRPHHPTRHPGTLLATEDNENQRKGAKGPDEWLPPWDRRAEQLFVAKWINVKTVWKLTMTETEHAACATVLNYRSM